MQPEQSSSSNRPAGFFLRLLAALDEWAIFLIIISFLLFNLSGVKSLKELTGGLVDALTIVLGLIIIRIVYNVLFTYYFGGTIGKLITGLRVKREEGGSLSLNQVLFRQLLSYRFSAMLLGLGFFSILKDENKQGWHDKTIRSNVFLTMPLYPFAIAVLLGALYLNYYLLGNALQNFNKGPLPSEINTLMSSFKTQPRPVKREVPSTSPVSSISANLLQYPNN